MESMQGKNILVIDDEPNIVNIIKAYLEKANASVYCAYDGQSGLELFEANKIDLIVLDLMLPNIQGEEVCRRIRGKSNVPILMLTAKVEEEDELAGLGLGADDYITKPFSNRILMARIDTLLRRTTPNMKQNLLFSDGVLEVNMENRSAKKNGELLPLSKIELNILIELLKISEKTFTRDELIDIVLGYDFEGIDRTIDSHIKNLRKKIEDDPKHPKYIITVHGIGYKFGVSHTINE